jgi:hypothetical protein
MEAHLYTKERKSEKTPKPKLQDQVVKKKNEVKGKMEVGTAEPI